jgi:hypothetical protein
MIKRSNLTAEIEMLKRLEFGSWQESNGLKKSWESIWKAQKWSNLGTWGKLVGGIKWDGSKTSDHD